ncbi:hypothetical protein KIH75_06510 [Bifidobacterium sp. 64T4]|uniref:hypothetical protein n=1 Tax=Bifidobacterium pongonis TaxID=2834432 RepID=UPI001C57B8FD|nr:hypothetical protein [Bifidobacterium pongonis]MBW3094988.1 hypothetical protein [Bifidobacterium pongonis]
MQRFSYEPRRVLRCCGGILKRYAVLILVLQFLTLSACTQRANVVKFSDADLTDAVIAFSMNYQVRKIDIMEHKGYMILVRKDGSYSAIVTSGMGTQVPLWTRRFLYFSDRDKDYRLSADGTERHVTDFPKTNVQNHMLEVDENTVLGVYDKGFTKDRDNQLQLVWYTPDPTNMTTVNTNRMHAIASCDGQVYGVKQETPVLGDDFRLNLIAFAPNMPARKVASVDNENPSFQLHDTSNGVPCVAGRILLLESLDSEPDESLTPGDGLDGLTMFNAPSTFRAVMKWWNVKTGDIQTIPVRYPDGTELAGERIMGFEYDPYCLDQNGRLLAVDSRTGTLRAIDSRTGTILQQVQPTFIEKEDNGYFYLRATRDYAFLLFDAVRIGSYLPKLFIYRIHDLEPVAEITFGPALMKLIDDEPDLHLTEFVPNPVIAF